MLVLTLNIFIMETDHERFIREQKEAADSEVQRKFTEQQL